MKKSKAVIWIAVFIIIIYTPFLSYKVLSQYVDTENYENRNSTEKPKLTLTNIDKFPQQFESYFNDMIPYRNQLVGLNSGITFFVFQQSPKDDVVIGKNNWFFYASDGDGNAVEQSLGYWNFEEDKLKKIADNLTKAKDILENEGIEFVLFIPPNKETVYKENMPDYLVQRNEQTSVMQLVKYLRENTDIRVVYPYDELMSAKQEYRDELFYYKFDTHWNDMGAYVGAKSLTEELGITMPTLEALTIQSTAIDSGDLTNVMHVKLPGKDKQYQLSGYSILETNCDKYDIGTEFIYHTTNADSRKLLVERDSFSTLLAQYVASQFENSYFVNENIFDKSKEFKQYNPDVFVYEVVERNIYKLSRFELSYLSSDIQEEDASKCITIQALFDEKKPKYVSIFKEDDETGEVTNIQILSDISKDVRIVVPKEETGTVYAYVFGDQEGKEELEEIKIVY